MELQKNEIEKLRTQLLGRFKQGGAHADLAAILKKISWEQAGRKNEVLPYNIWQLAEHIRISQYDILEFCRNPLYESPDWPSGYWPKETTPESEEEWLATVTQIKEDNKTFAALIAEPQADLLKAFDHGTGQTIFNEALLIIDHNAYHAGQIVLIAKINGWWS